MIGMAILLAGAGLITLWRQQHLLFYRTQIEAAEVLRNSEVRYRRLFEASRDGILILDAETGVIVDANPFLGKMLGFSHEEFRGKKIWDLGFFKDIVANQSNFLELQQKKYVRYDNLPLKTEHGQRIEVEFVSNVYLVNHQKVIQCNIRDITERKQNEDMLMAERNLLHTLIDILPDYIFVKDVNSRLVLNNIAHQRHLGAKSLEDVAGKTDFDFFPREIAAPFIADEEKIIRSGEAMINREEPSVDKDGNQTWLLTTKAPLRDHQGIITGIVGINHDITQRKRTEQQLANYTEHLEEMVEERTRELREAQEQLVRQERLAMLGQLAGSIGHELRNPLGVISNAVYFLKMSEPNASDRVKEYLDIIEKETHTSDKIITDLLDFTRIKSLDRQPASVFELIHQTLERYPAPPSVEVALEIPTDLPKIYADPQHILQVLINLVSNACQSMVRAGLTTGMLNVGRLTISAFSLGDMIKIDVQDMGMGIPPENMKKLFEPLFTTKTKGIGLGLAVSRKLTEANGGRIEVQSEPGKGSTFSVYLPIYRQENP